MKECSLFYDYEIHETRMFQIVFLVSFESSQWGGVHLTLSHVHYLKVYLVILLVMKFCHFVKSILKKNSVTNSLFKKENSTNFQEKEKDSPKIVTIACNMKGYLRFCTFILWIVPHLVKYTCGWSSLEQYRKIGKK